MKAIAILLLLAIQSIGFCQRESIGFVTLPNGTAGSCVVIEKTSQLPDGWLGLAVTADHMTKNQNDITVTYFSGRRSLKCSVAAADPEADLSIIRVWIPNEVPVAPLVTTQPEGDVVLFGFPAGKFDTLRGKFIRRIERDIFIDILNRPGFSGGGVFHGDKLVGCISGGWFWTRDEQGRQSTWPTKATCGEEIVSLLDKARKESLAPTVAMVR